MDALMKSFSLMKERMSKLEEENDSLSMDVLELKKENIILKKDIRQLKSETTLKNLQQEDDFPEKDQIQIFKQRLSDIQGEVKRQTDIVRKVESSQVDVRNEMKRLKGTLEEMKSSQIDSKEERDLLQCLKMSLNRVLVRAHKASTQFNTKVPALESRLDDLEKDNSLHKKLAGHHLGVVLNCSKTKVSTGVDYKLDKCLCLLSGTFFDVQTSCIVPPFPGCYVVHTYMDQEGEGEIRLSARWGIDGANGGVFCGQTDRDNGNATSLNFLELEQGEKVWFEARRRTGECNIGWCLVNVWLLH